MRTLMIGALVALSAAVLSAHVTVAPRESAPGISQRYTVRVPTEGQIATVALDLEVPQNVTVTDIPMGDGFTVEARRDAGRIVAITWTREIKPRESAEFVVVATNPATAVEVMWKAHQRFADGTSADWVGVQGDRRPAAVTRITATPTGAAQQH